MVLCTIYYTMVSSILQTILLTSLLHLSTCGGISDSRKCADRYCQVKISVGRTTQDYTGIYKNILKFKVDEIATVYSKEAGNNTDLWGVEINGKRGYVHKKFIKEEKVFVRDLAHIVATSPDSPNENVSSPPNETSSQETELSNNSNENTPEKKIIEPSSTGSKPIEKDDKTENIHEPPKIPLTGEGVEFGTTENSVDQNPEESKKAEEPLNASEQQLVKDDLGNSNIEIDLGGIGGVEKDLGKETVANNVNEFETGTPEMDSKVETPGIDDQSLQGGKSTGAKDLIQDADVVENKVIESSEENVRDKEIDNEDEGNGNEGEENGSEYSVKQGFEESDNVIDAAHPKELEQLMEQSQNTADEQRQNTVEDLSPDPIHTSLDTPSTSPEPQDLPLDSDSLVTTIKPLPSQTFEVVQGTTIYMEPEDQPSSGIEGLSHLQGTQLKNDKASTGATPSFPKANKRTITEMPILLKKNYKESTNVPGASNSYPSKENTVPTNQQDEDSSNEDHTEAPDSTQETFGPPKPDTLVDSSETEHIEEQQAFLPSMLSSRNGEENHQNVDPVNLEEVNPTGTQEVIQQSDTESSEQTNEDLVPEEMPSPTDIDSSQDTNEEEENKFDLEEEMKSNKIDDSGVDVTEGDNNSKADTLEPIIASLPFLDLDSTQFKPSEEVNVQDSDVVVESADDPQNAIGTQGTTESSETSSENGSIEETTKGPLDSEEESKLSSLKEKFMDASEPLLQWFAQTVKLSEGMSLAIEGELADPHMSTGTLIFLLVASGTIVVLYLSHMIMVKMSRESPLIQMMNELDRNKRILVEENNNLKRKLTDCNGQISYPSSGDPVELVKLREAMESVESETRELRERNQQLENDLESSTANEVELHRMLNELLSNQKETSSFEDSVNDLQKMLDGQREVVENLTSDLALKTRLNDELRNELRDSKAKTSKLEHQIEQITRSLEDVNASKQEYLQKLTKEENSLLSLKEMNESLRQEIDKAAQLSNGYYQESLRLSGELRNLRQRLNGKEAECQVSKECLKKLQVLSDGGGNDVGGKLNEIFKIIEVKSRLSSTEKECSTLKTQLEERETSQNALNERVNNLENEIARLRDTSNTLQKERDGAQSKLAVLTQYYEEKEEQLKKALESQEGLLLNAEGSAAVVNNRIQTYEIELMSCRSQLESLKQELEEQKQSYKIQLTNEEKKLHDNWLAARSAERRQEELRQENTQLRQRLTQMQRDSEQNMMLKASKRVDANGSVSSPIPMENNLDSMPLDLDGPLPHLPPPPMMPHMFAGRPPLPPGLPPPPMHPHLFGPLPPPPMPDRRLPPAGRIASPPGYDRRCYSPGSDHSHYSDQRYSPPGPRYSPGGSHRGARPCDQKAGGDHHPRRNPNARRVPRSPSPSDGQRHSPERWYTQSPKGFAKHRRSPHSMDFYDGLNDSRRSLNNPGKGKKTSTPNDR